MSCEVVHTCDRCHEKITGGKPARTEVATTTFNMTCAKTVKRIDLCLGCTSEFIAFLSKPTFEKKNG